VRYAIRPTVYIVCDNVIVTTDRMHSTDAAYFTDVARSLVCVLGIPVNPAKADEPIEMPLGRTNACGPKKPPERAHVGAT